MQKEIGWRLVPSQGWWVWIAGLLCFVLLIQFYDPASPMSELEQEQVSTPAATLGAALPTRISRPATAGPKPTSSPTPTATTRPAATPTPIFHEVEAGEIPGTIAETYGIGVEVLLEANNIADPTLLQIGQKLLVPVTPTRAAAPPPTPRATPERKATPTAEPTLVFHTVEEGDTVLAIAMANDTTVEAIAAVNWLADPHRLQIGQKLALPPADGSMPNPVQWAPREIYEIRAGDTLIDIALEYGSTVDDILAVNPELDPNLMQIGQPVTVPLTRQKVVSGVARPSGSGEPKGPAMSAAELAVLKSSSPSLTGLEQEMVAAVNAARQTRGLPSLEIDAELTLMAWERAQDMVARSYISHVTPEGETLRDRFRGLGWSTVWVGENIYLSTQPANQAVSRTMGWFLGDAPHRANILNPNFNRIGIGVAQGPSGWYTFVQVFAQK